MEIGKETFKQIDELYREILTRAKAVDRKYFGVRTGLIGFYRDMARLKSEFQEAMTEEERETNTSIDTRVE